MEYEGVTEAQSEEISESILLHAQVCVHAQIFYAVSTALSYLACQSRSALDAHVRPVVKILFRGGCADPPRRVRWCRTSRLV